jgi:elongation factor P hydroxylase
MLIVIDVLFLNRPNADKRLFSLPSQAEYALIANIQYFFCLFVQFCFLSLDKKFQTNAQINSIYSTIGILLLKFCKFNGSVFLKILPFLYKSGTIKQAEDLVTLFNYCFATAENTILLGGAEEPIYEPASDNCEYNRLFFTRDYFSSALHEIAHWCIAGKERRSHVDYAYWYHPDGRDPAQQAKFEAAEIKPQAIEQAFSLAAGIKFRVSIDNLENEKKSSDTFALAVDNQLESLIQSGFNPRTQVFLNTLHDFYNTPALTTFDYKQINSDYGVQA